MSALEALRCAVIAAEAKALEAEVEHGRAVLAVALIGGAGAHRMVRRTAVELASYNRDAARLREAWEARQ
jgi:hypothetical protein